MTDSAEVARALHGSWRLPAWTIADGTGVRTPSGTDPPGAAVIAAPDRPVLPATKPSAASDAELAAAMLSFFSYAGSWHIEDQSVVHEADLSLNPAMVGTSQRREIELTDDVLVLSASDEGPRGPRRHA